MHRPTGGSSGNRRKPPETRRRQDTGEQPCRGLCFPTAHRPIPEHTIPACASLWPSGRSADRQGCLLISTSSRANASQSYFAGRPPALRGLVDEASTVGEVTGSAAVTASFFIAEQKIWDDIVCVKFQHRNTTRAPVPTQNRISLNGIGAAAQAPSGFEPTQSRSSGLRRTGVVRSAADPTGFCRERRVRFYRFQREPKLHRRQRPRRFAVSPAPALCPSSRHEPAHRQVFPTEEHTWCLRSALRKTRTARGSPCGGSGVRGSA